MDKKSILGFVFVFLIILAMPYYFKMVNPEQPTVPTTTSDQQKIAPTPDSSPQTVNVPIEHPKLKNIEKDILYTIDTELYRIVLSNRGGGTLSSFVLKNYQMITGNDTTLVELIRNSDVKSLFVRYISVDGDSVELSQTFSLETPRGGIPSKNTWTLRGGDSLSLSFVLKSSSGTLAQKTFVFHGDIYSIDLSTNVTGLRENIASQFYELSWEGGLPYTETLIKDDIYYSKAYAYNAGDAVDLDVKSGRKNQNSFTGNTGWTAVRNKYFTAAFLANGNGIGYRLTAEGLPLEGKDFQKVFNMYLSLPVGNTNQTRLFIGPLDYQIVKHLDVNLEEIMNFGASIIRPISKGILWVFIWMHTFIPNYGWVLIVFSILLKVVLTPLTNKSTQSMKEMQKLAPKTEVLKEKYGNDPQKLNTETMKLYKEHGVNPMGGCLPILLQMPILWALFIVFRSTIELRQAAFIGWITDLSAPDTIFTLPFAIPIYGSHVNLLPILMVLSQVIQQKLSTVSSNQQQKMMMYFMPIVFFFLFNQFPSGLNLYYTLFNILSIIQQKWLTPDAKPKKPKQRTIDAIRQFQMKAKKR
ncbi:MAG: membrane protein insertase YidC [Candidatus Neomarinimicrobiota bacterium]